MGCNNCEYVCDTPLGSYCTLTNESVDITDCHRDDQHDIEEEYEWLIRVN